jgi:hypothetical protein
VHRGSGLPVRRKYTLLPTKQAFDTLYYVSMNKHRQLIAVITFAVVQTLMTGCSKTSGQPQIQTQPAPPVVNAPIYHQTTAERLVEIDRLLAAPLTGRSDDADQRSILRSERAALGGSGNHAMVQYQPAVQHPVQNQAAIAPAAPKITVARDSSANSANRFDSTSRFETMAPSAAWNRDNAPKNRSKKGVSKDNDPSN